VLRHFLRSAPDVGMVSETRTADEAGQVLQFVISGHKIYTTIHSFEANHIPLRLISLGVELSEVSAPGVISLIMYQKLVPELCPHCARPATPAEAAHIAAEFDANMRKDGYPAGYVERSKGGETAFRPMVRNRAGCPACLEERIERLREQLQAYGADRLEVAIETATSAWGGLSQRRAVAEHIRVDNTYRGFIAGNDPIGAKAYWLKPASEGGMGGRPVPVQIADLVARGQVDYVDATHDERLREIGKREQTRAVGVESGKHAVAQPQAPHDDSSLY